MDMNSDMILRTMGLVISKEICNTEYPSDGHRMDIKIYDDVIKKESNNIKLFL